MSRRLELWLVVGFLLFGVAIRLANLQTIPGGFSENEIAHLRITESIRAGNILVFSPSHRAGGIESFFALLETASVIVFGEGLFGYRILPFGIGILTLALTYKVAQRFFGSLVGLLALGGMSINIWSVILARTIGHVNIVPMLLLLTLFMLSKAYHIKQEISPLPVKTNTFTFFAVTLAATLYSHYTGIFVVLGVVGFLIYLERRKLSVLRQVWWNSSYALILTLILALPYIISLLRNPQNSGLQFLWAEQVNSLGTGLESLWLTLRAFLPLPFIADLGDTNPANNIPGLPPLSPLESVLLIAGIAISIQRWKSPNFALILILLGCGLLPDIWLEGGPNYPALILVHPLLFILVGIGIKETLRIIQESRDLPERLKWLHGFQWRQMKLQPLAVISVIFIGFGFAQNLTRLDTYFFDEWTTRRDTRFAYAYELGQFALYLDQTRDETPVLLCTDDLTDSPIDDLKKPLSSPQLITLMMYHDKSVSWRVADCQIDFVLTDGGNPMRLLFLDHQDPNLLPLPIREWLSSPTVAKVLPDVDLPADSLWYLDARQTLADRGGELEARAAIPEIAAYYPWNSEAGSVAAPHAVRFGGNMTFLGYYRYPEGNHFQPGEVITLVSYWRIEGPISENTGVFLRLHDTPQVSPYAEVNIFKVRATQLQARDVVVQVVQLTLPENLRPQPYILTLGVYDNNPTNQLPVYQGDPNQVRGDYLQLGIPFMVRPLQQRILG